MEEFNVSIDEMKEALEKEKRKNYTSMFDMEKRYKEVYSPTNKTESKEERVNHPSHYTWLKDVCGVEVIDITRHMNFNLGNVLKYVLRAGHKSEEGMSSNQKKIEDLQKAIFYLNDEIQRLNNL